VRAEPGESREIGRRQPGSQLGHRYQTSEIDSGGLGWAKLAHIKHALYIPRGHRSPLSPLTLGFSGEP
jgi:hypothetical protein